MGIYSMAFSEARHAMKGERSWFACCRKRTLEEYRNMVRSDEKKFLLKILIKEEWEKRDPKKDLPNFHKTLLDFEKSDVSNKPDGQQFRNYYDRGPKMMRFFQQTAEDVAAQKTMARDYTRWTNQFVDALCKDVANLAGTKNILSLSLDDVT